LKLQSRRSGLDIDAETTIPLWEGERMDEGMAMEGLLQAEQAGAVSENHDPGFARCLSAFFAS